MKLETAIIVTKGLVVVGAAFASALVGSLSQWSNDAGNPSAIQWVIIVGTAVSAGATALGGFLSSAFGKYLEQTRNGNGGTVPPVKPQP